MEAALFDRLVTHCEGARFTGILRVRAREGIGEVWFLSGLVDELHFGTSTADEARDRMRKATDATYELASRLPHPGGGFKQRFPSKGSIATATPVTLMRYCERYALTCTLAVESGGVLVEATYELGELASVETTADDDGITAMLEAHEGTYEFILPRVELPEGTPVLPPPSTRLESLPPPEVPAFRALLEAKPAVGRPASDEAEVKRKTVEIAHRPKKAAATLTVPRPAEASKTPPAVAPVPSDEKREAEKREAEKREAQKREAEKREAEKREAEKREAEKRAAEEREAKEREAEKHEAEKREAESAAAPKEDQPEEDEPEEDEPALDEREPDSVKPPPPATTQNGSWTWLVVSLLVAAALGYLFWTHRL